LDINSGPEIYLIYDGRSSKKESTLGGARDRVHTIENMAYACSLKSFFQYIIHHGYVACTFLLRFTVDYKKEREKYYLLDGCIRMKKTA
jgi:hypothetical protein